MIGAVAIAMARETSLTRESFRLTFLEFLRSHPGDVGYLRAFGHDFEAFFLYAPTFEAARRLSRQKIVS